MCKRALIAMVYVLLVPVVVPAVVPGTQEEEVQAVQQCGSAASDAAICAGRGLEAAGQAEASERWGWVGRGAVVAVAGATTGSQSMRALQPHEPCVLRTHADIASKASSTAASPDTHSSASA